VTTDDAQPVVAARLSSRDRHDYVARVRLAAERLVAQRYLRAEDIELVVGLAAERYDVFAPSQVEAGAADL